MKAGLSPNMIKSIEQGRHALSAQLIISIAEVIETDPVDLTKGAIGLSESDEQLMKDLTRKKVKTKKIRYGFAILIQ